MKILMCPLFVSPGAGFDNVPNEKNRTEKTISFLSLGKEKGRKSFNGSNLRNIEKGAT